MQVSLTSLTKRAIDAALKSDWNAAIDINLQILEISPDNLEAKIRLGRAYTQTKQFEKAKKTFREVLKVDPINSIALKNLEIAKEGKVDHKNLSNVDTRSLLKEPGTTFEINILITAKGITADSFTPGELLPNKVKKKSVTVYKNRKDDTVEIGEIDKDDVVSKLNTCINKEGRLTISYSKGKDKNITLLLKTSLPVFKSEKQDIRPYIKKGSFDEPELELEEEIVVES